MNNNNQSNILDVLGGRESVKFDVSITWQTLIELFAVIVLSAVLILYLKKAILK